MSRLRLLPSLASLALAGSAFMGCASSGSDGITTTHKPSMAQLDAMSTYFQAHELGMVYGGADRGGCATYSMATRRESKDRLVAYTQVMCSVCPQGDGGASAGGLTPAVFVLDGPQVLKVDAATAPGDPGFFDEIQHIFQPSLWSEANAQNVPESQSLEQLADDRTRCG